MKKMENLNIPYKAMALILKANPDLSDFEINRCTFVDIPEGKSDVAGCNYGEPGKEYTYLCGVKVSPKNFPITMVRSMLLPQA